MEYIAKCPECKGHTIVKTIKQIKHSLTEKLPQRVAVCDHCGKTARMTILGTVEDGVKVTNELDPECGTTNTLRFNFWMKPLVKLAGIPQS